MKEPPKPLQRLEGKPPPKGEEAMTTTDLMSTRWTIEELRERAAALIEPATAAKPAWALDPTPQDFGDSDVPGYLEISFRGPDVFSELGIEGDVTCEAYIEQSFLIGLDGGEVSPLDTPHPALYIEDTHSLTPGDLDAFAQALTSLSMRFTFDGIDEPMGRLRQQP